MAHMIEERNGRFSYAESVAKEMAWHGLGEHFTRPMFVKEALEACRANFDVESQPIAAISPQMIEAIQNGTFNMDMLLDSYVPNKRATVRTDLGRSLGIVSDTYGIVQNATAFSFIDTFCSGMKEDRDECPVIDACGVLGNGERIFITAKMPEKHRIVLNKVQGDIVDMYVVFTTSHDGSGAVTAMVTPVRVVCNNTLNFAFKHNAGRLSFRHTSKVNERLDLLNKENAQFAYKTLGLVESYKAIFEESLMHLRNLKLAEKQVDDILADVLLSEESAKIFKETRNILHEDIPTRGRNIFIGVKDGLDLAIGQDMLDKGSGLWLVNGLTSYYQNHTKDKDSESKFETVTDGSVQKKLQKTYNLLATIAA